MNFSMVLIKMGGFFAQGWNTLDVFLQDAAYLENADRLLLLSQVFETEEEPGLLKRQDKEISFTGNRLNKYRCLYRGVSHQLRGRQPRCLIELWSEILVNSQLACT